MENKQCSLCGNIDKDGILYMYELNDEKFICIKCQQKMSEKENKIFLSKLKSFKMSENYIDNLLSNEEYKKLILRIVSWNCNWGLSIEKYNDVLKFNPQILLIQECSKNDFDYLKNMWEFKNWYNDDQKNNGSEYGLAIFSNDYKITFTEIFNREFRYIIPYIVSKNEYQFTLFSTWIHPIKENYKEHLYEAIEFYRRKNMMDNNSIIIGDFNIFANKNNENLMELENKLSQMINCTKNTVYWEKSTYYHGKDEKGNDNYGINDFCFVSKNINKDFTIDVNILDEWDVNNGKFKCWKGLSDHSPIIVDIKLK